MLRRETSPTPTQQAVLLALGSPMHRLPAATLAEVAELEPSACLNIALGLADSGLLSVENLGPFVPGLLQFGLTEAGVACIRDLSVPAQTGPHNPYAADVEGLALAALNATVSYELRYPGGAATRAQVRAVLRGATTHPPTIASANHAIDTLLARHIDSSLRVTLRGLLASSWGAIAYNICEVVIHALQNTDLASPAPRMTWRALWSHYGVPRTLQSMTHLVVTLGGFGIGMYRDHSGDWWAPTRDVDELLELGLKRHILRVAGEPDASQHQRLAPGPSSSHTASTPADGTQEPNIEGIGDAALDDWDDYPLDELAIRDERRTAEDVVRRIAQGRFVLDPDFQREFVWDEKKQSRLIESILMRIPLPVFYVAEDLQGRLVVVDGRQRLTTLQRFLTNKLFLQLPHRRDLNGLAFQELGVRLQNRVHDCQLLFYIIDHKVPERARLDIFERVNGGEVLTRQQMRNAIYCGPATNFLRDEASTELFIAATGRSLTLAKCRTASLLTGFARSSCCRSTATAGIWMSGSRAASLRWRMRLMPESLIFEQGCAAA